MPGKPSRNDALDGVRLLAVAAVMAFHFGLPHAAAGFLGVDVFFVLSGYLITSLLLAQLEGGRVRVIEFWTRRARRLIPALLVVLGVVVGWSAFVAPSVARDGLRGDVTATLFYVANWHLISTSSYFASDGVPSPLQHMWSLAVEEQFYLVWPLLVAFTALVVRQPRRRLIAVGAITGAGLVASAIRLEMLWATAGQDRAYLGTDSRIFEPLAGALLAVSMTSGSVRGLVARSHWLLLALGGAGLGWALVTLGDPAGATRAYADGGAVVVAVSAAAVIAALATRSSPATRALALPAIAYLGRLAYGMYLWHWPLQVWTQRYGWWDLSGLALAARASVLTLLTVALAALSYHLIEAPIRYGTVARLLVPRRAVVVVPLVLGAMFVINSSIVLPRAGAATATGVTRTIVLVGDSVPQRLAPYLAKAAARRGYVVISATRGSCPASGVAVVDATGKPWGAGTACATDVPARQDAAVAKYRPALVIWWSRYEVADRVDSHGNPVPFDTLAYWALQEKAFATRTAALTRHGATVVAVQIERSGLGMATRCTPVCGPFLERLIQDTAAQNTWNAFLASHTIGSVRSISIQSLVCRNAASPCNDRLPDGSLARPDGTHYSPTAAPKIASAVIDRSLAAAGL